MVSESVALPEKKPGNALTEFLLAIEEMGNEKTAKALFHERKKCALQNNEDANAVLRIVSRVFKVPVTEITHGVMRKNDRQAAIGFCAYYLHFRFDYEMSMVAHKLNKSQRLCYKYSKQIRDLKTTSKADKKYCAWKRLFDTEISLLLASKNNSDDN